MKTIEAGAYSLIDCGRINILFGKNGCGKSTALKEIAVNLRSKNNGLVNYLTPERGGVLTYESSIEQNMGSPGWKNSVRNTNQFGQFRQQSVVVFKDLRATINLELERYLKKCKTDGSASASIGECEKYFFDHYIGQINSLLDNVEVRPFRATFQIFSKDNKEISPANISSGESELITLGIECLSHELECNPDEENILFLDEPDVHIHPDLQAKLMHFLKTLVDTKKFIVVIATHSTAILGALEDYEHVHFEFMKKNQKHFTFKKVLKEYKQIIPIFGAHPLSNIYCSMPIFLVEGEDDVWVWQKAIRTSGGLLQIFPCAVDGVDEMLRYEKIVSEIIGSIYDADKVMAYSLRDRDDIPEGNNLDDYGKFDKIERFMLSCRCAENLFLSEEVLARLKTDWRQVTAEINEWLRNNSSHKVHAVMSKFQQGGYDRKKFENIKDIINILVGLVTNQPWQVVVGQEIGELVKNQRSLDATKEHSMANYLGAEITSWIQQEIKSNTLTQIVDKKSDGD